MTYTLYQGDCLEILPTLANVNAIITDPPYGTGEHIRVASGTGRNFRSKHHIADWDKWSLEWLRMAVRGIECAIVFSSERSINDVIDCARSAGKPYRLLSWCKSDPMPTFDNRPGYGIDPIICIGELQPVGGRNWIEASTPRRNRDAEYAGHPHQKPLKVMQWLVRVGCQAGGTILDPFMGSGSTGVAAVLSGRNFIGIELDAKYYRIAERRIANAQLPLFVADAPAVPVEQATMFVGVTA